MTNYDAAMELLRGLDLYLADPARGNWFDRLLARMLRQCVAEWLLHNPPAGRLP